MYSAIRFLPRFLFRAITQPVLQSNRRRGNTMIPHHRAGVTASPILCSERAIRGEYRGYVAAFTRLARHEKPRAERRRDTERGADRGGHAEGAGQRRT